MRCRRKGRPQTQTRQGLGRVVTLVSHRAWNPPRDWLPWPLVAPTKTDRLDALRWRDDGAFGNRLLCDGGRSSQLPPAANRTAPLPVNSTAPHPLGAAIGTIRPIEYLSWQLCTLFLFAATISSLRAPSGSDRIHSPVLQCASARNAGATPVFYLPAKPIQNPNKLETYSHE